MAASKMPGKSGPKEGTARADASPKGSTAFSAGNANAQWDTLAVAPPVAVGLQASARAVQRADGDAPPAGPPAVGGVLIASDDASEVSAGQLRKTEFLDEAQQRICEAIDPILAGAGRSSENCPYLGTVFRYLRRQSAAYLDGAIRQFAPELAEATSARDYLPGIVRRVTESADGWVRTGQITGLPPEVPSLAALVSGDLSSLDSLADLGALLSLQFKGDGTGSAAQAPHPAAVQAQLTHGRPLDGGAASRLGSAFGADFGGVRVHSDARAASLARNLGARALAVGTDIAFAPGQYQPGTVVGDALIAHELAHVLQQRNASPDSGTRTGDPTSYRALEEDADQAAIDAIARVWGRDGAAAAPSLRGGLRLSRCGGPEPPTAEEIAEFLATQHLRIVVIQETHEFLAGMRKSVAVAANTSENLDDANVREGDELIHGGLDWPRLLSVIVDMPSPSGSGPRYERPSALHARTGNFTVHFMSEGEYHLTAHVSIGPGHPPVQVRRTISVRAPTFQADSESEAPADLSSGARTVDEERMAWHLHRADVRQRAATAGFITQEVVDSWTDVAIAVLQRVALLEQSQPPGTTQAEITTALDRFASEVNALPVQIAAARGVAASTSVSAIRTAVDALSRAFDNWVLARIEAGSSSDHELYKSLQFGLQSEQEVENLAARSTVPPVRIPAIFHPKSAYLHQGLIPTSPMSTGRILSMPLNLWLFREGTQEWTLRDISNPEETSEYDVTTADRDAAINDLIRQLSVDDERLPEGRLYIQPPGQSRRAINVVSSMDFLDWLTVFGIGLVVAGAIVMTAGAATPVVAAAGGYMVAAGSALTAAAAIVDTVQVYERGRLTGTRLALNALQLVASVATAGSATIMARAARVGALARLGSNARYVFLNRTATAADIVTLIVMTGDAARQMSRLSGNSQNAGMIASMLLGQLLIQGTLTVVSARDAFGGNMSRNPHISIDDAIDGSGLVVRAGVDVPSPARLAGTAPEPPPTGAAHGTDVHPLTNLRVDGTGATVGALGPRRVDEILTGMARHRRAHGGVMTRLGENHFQMVVPSPSGPQTVEIRVQVTATLPDTPSHRPTGGGPSQAGAARLQLDPPGTAGGPWTATVFLDNRLPRPNAEINLADEIDEIAGVLHSRPTATRAEVAAEMDNSLFRRGAGANPPVTADDRATAGALFELHSRRLQTMRRAEPLRARTTPTADEVTELARLDAEIAGYDVSVARLQGYMALDEASNIDQKMMILRQAATDPDRLARVPPAVRQQLMEQWEDFLRDMRLRPAATTLGIHGGSFGAGGVGPTAYAPQSAAHLMYPEPHAAVPRSSPGQFRDNGISGGHHDAALLDFQNNHPEYGYFFRPEGTPVVRGGQTYRRYTQFMWTGTGNPPAPGTAGHPSGRGTLGAGWVESVQPKTTVTDIGAFLEDSERALWQFVRNPTRIYRDATGAAIGTGQARFFGPTARGGTSIPFTHTLAGGPRISGFFDFDPTAVGAARFQIRTAFIDASWIP
ncbi:MAG: DUF4157 domain-containing protein [Limisphaerales bacterium]